MTHEVVARFTIQVEQLDGFQFVTRFDKEQYEPVRTDEPPPLGKDSAPNPARLLAAAVGDCLSASLVFCLKRAGVQLQGMKTAVDVELIRNEHRRLRVGKIDVRLHPELPVDHPALAQCLSTFEDFCVVTQSVREGIDVFVQIEPDLSSS